MSETVAVILAAGVGSRLRPLTDSVPKCLVDLNGETMLHRALRVLHDDGITRAIVVTGYRDDAVRSAVRSAKGDVRVVHNARYEDTQNMLSLAVALREFPAGCAMVKLDGDVVFKRGLVSGLTRAGVPCAVAVERGHTLGAEEMKVELENGRIARFGKGIDPARAHGESIGIEWIGAHGVEPVRLALERAVRDGRTNLYYEDVYNDLLPGLEMHAVTVASSEWTEVDDLPDLERARALVKAWDA